MSKTLFSSVGIIGCGWLGKALLPLLAEKNYHIVATSQDPKKITLLNHFQGVSAEPLSLPISDIQAYIKDENNRIFTQQCLIIAIPPQLKKGRLDYPDKIQQLVSLAEKKQVKRIILLSTTAVYNGLSGQVHEESALNFDAEKVAVIAQAEQLVLNFKGEGIVLRLAGLLGPDRHPANFIKRNPSIAQSIMPVNLIHQEDVIGLLLSLLNKPRCSGVYNAVSKTHLSKNEFYRAAAKSQSMSLPELLTQAPTQDKIVSGDKVKEETGYIFKYDDLLMWLALGSNNG